jgi:hypothetical protein
MIRPIALAFLMLTGACASTPGDTASRETAKKPLRGVVAEFQLTSYDGEDIKGRVLIGATVDPLVMDSHPLESADLELVNLRACGEKREVPHIIFDLVGTYPMKVITIRPGYWYGKNVVYGFFEKKRGLGPECLEAELVVRDHVSRVATRLPIRVVRTDKPPAPPDGGAPAEPKPPPSDGGAP